MLVNVLGQFVYFHKPMTLEVFQSYNLAEQAKTLADKGELIASRYDTSTKVNLYAMAGFYAEIYASTLSLKILEIKVVQNHQVLNDYVDSLKVGAE